MRDRIKLIRKEAKLSQEEFARRLGLTRGFISRVEIDQATFSDRTIKDICREFHVNEEWLRFGTGEMKAYESNDVMSVLNDLIKDPDNEFYKRIIGILQIYHELDDKSRAVLDEIMNKMAEKAKQD